MICAVILFNNNIDDEKIWGFARMRFLSRILIFLSFKCLDTPVKKECLIYSNGTIHRFVMRTNVINKYSRTFSAIGYEEKNAEIFLVIQCRSNIQKLIPFKSPFNDFYSLSRCICGSHFIFIYHVSMPKKK